MVFIMQNGNQLSDNVSSQSFLTIGGSNVLKPQIERLGAEAVKINRTCVKTNLKRCEDHMIDNTLFVMVYPENQLGPLIGHT